MTARNHAILVISVLLVALAACVFPRQSTRAQATTYVRVIPETVSANVGDVFAVAITLNDVENLYGVEALLTWNSSVLQCLRADVRLGQADGVLSGEPLIAENSTTTGRYIISATSVNPAPPFSGSGNIVSVTFEVVGEGTTKLALQSELDDYPPLDRYPRISYPIDHTSFDGWFQTVVPEFQEVTLIVALIILGTVTLLLLKRSQWRNSDDLRHRSTGSVEKAITSKQDHRTGRSAR